MRRNSKSSSSDCERRSPRCSRAWIAKAFMSALLAVQIAACGPRAPIALPVSGTPLVDEEAALLQSRLAERRAAVSTLRVLAEAVVAYEDEQGTARYGVAATSDPSALRVDLLAPSLAYSLGVFVSTHRGELFLDTSQREVWRRGEGKLLEEVLGLPVTRAQMIALLAGLPPPGAQVEVYRTKQGVVARTLDGSWRALLDPATGLPSLVHILPPGSAQPLLEMRYEAYTSLEPLLLPHVLHGKEYRHGASFILTLSRWKVGDMLAASLFEVRVPSSYRERS